MALKASWHLHEKAYAKHLNFVLTWLVELSTILAAWICGILEGDWFECGDMADFKAEVQKNVPNTKW